jgi:hypothetical protein
MKLTSKQGKTLRTTIIDYIYLRTVYEVDRFGFLCHLVHLPHLLCRGVADLYSGHGSVEVGRHLLQ